MDLLVQLWVGCVMKKKGFKQRGKGVFIPKEPDKQNVADSARTLRKTLAEKTSRRVSGPETLTH